METRVINISYDTPNFEYGLNRINGFQTANFYRHGTLQVEAVLPPESVQQLNSFLNSYRSSFDNRVPMPRNNLQVIMGDQNSATFKNAIMTSVSWGVDEQNNQMYLNLDWRFSGVQDVVAIPPIELRPARRLLPVQNLDWRSYGF
jgi:hypothetical protein